MKQFVHVLFAFSAVLLTVVSGAHAADIREIDIPIYHGKPVSLDIQDSSIDSVLRIFAEIMNINIVPHPAVSGKVRNLRLIDVPSDQAFQVLLRMEGLYSVEEDGVIIVYPVDLYLREVQQRIHLKHLF